MIAESVDVSIIIPVFNKLAFTRQCLDRIARAAGGGPAFEVVIVDNGSRDGTAEFFAGTPDFGCPVRYLGNEDNLGFSRANNLGARQSEARYLLFLNNDTLVVPGWLEAMVEVAQSDPRVGVVGIKQLFPYTNRIHHTGIIFTADRRPQHLYPHADGSLSHVNKEREYQAVTGSCLLIPRDLFTACGMFDEGYRNGYEDVDLCLAVRRQGRSVVCCTRSFIYHYGQISETRTADDDRNAERLLAKWAGTIRPDEHEYFRQDRREIEHARPSDRQTGAGRTVPRDLVYFADDLSVGSALSWVTLELIHALDRLGVPVALRQADLSRATDARRRRRFESLMRVEAPVGGVQIRWSHYWPQHLNLDLHGRLNAELFVINYLFDRPGAEPWDYWLQCVGHNGYRKLALSGFCREVLQAAGVPPAACHLVQPGYSPEVLDVAPPSRRPSGLRFLTVTNSHDLDRYGTSRLLEAYWSAFSRRDDVTLIVKDYGTSSGDTSLRDLIRRRTDAAAVEYIGTFTSKAALIALYKSCDAFVSAHRGEGYGMKILDALACGLPVVTPLFGGPTDFCTPSNCLPVDFTLTPVTAGLDARSLRLTNGPMWAEPSAASLAHRLREIADDPAGARALGARARADVLDRFTWDAAARQLLEAVSAEDAPPRAALPAAAATARPPAEASPYWLGCRVSVVIPTHNRSGMLRTCLRALERQSILPQEFEVIVVDDGSTDDTQAMLASESFPFELTALRQPPSGPGTARNLGVAHARGELVLLIGDDIIAEPRLLEAHLVAHATRPASTAILGHIDWPPDMHRSAVMDFVCGPSTLQFAYAFIPDLPKLDFRFFYTSNISLKRQFLVDAAADGVAFDPAFTAAAFEDSELAFRLEPRGLEIVYCGEARVYHHHWMDLESFSRREYAAGRMAVVFYRKHPQIDEQLQVRWIGDWTPAVEDLLASPELQARLRTLDESTRTFLESLARTLEDLARLQDSLGTDLFSRRSHGAPKSHLLDAVFAVVFDVERTRGKVAAWYDGVDDARKVELAQQLLGCIRRLEFLSASPTELQKLRGTIRWLTTDVVGGFETRVSTLEQRFGGSPADLARLRAGTPDASAVERVQTRLSGLERHLNGVRRRRWSARHVVVGTLRRTDFFIQRRLGDRRNPRLLQRYQAMRRRLRQLLFTPPSPPS